MAFADDFRIGRNFRGDYFVGHLEGDELVNVLPWTYETREQAEEALADLERAEAEESAQ